jgi:hypothetical protein
VPCTIADVRPSQTLISHAQHDCPHSSLELLAKGNVRDGAPDYVSAWPAKERTTEALRLKETRTSPSFRHLMSTEIPIKLHRRYCTLFTGVSAAFRFSLSGTAPNADRQPKSMQTAQCKLALLYVAHGEANARAVGRHSRWAPRERRATTCAASLSPAEKALQEGRRYRSKTAPSFWLPAVCRLAAGSAPRRQLRHQQRGALAVVASQPQVKVGAYAVACKGPCTVHCIARHVHAASACWLAPLPECSWAAVKRLRGSAGAQAACCCVSSTSADSGPHYLYLGGPQRPLARRHRTPSSCSLTPPHACLAAE